ncbi:hypothetical protein [Stenotrophomonas maltophilia]|uniref:hypothetical protein n=1 Tax=Stenotrophomonas maltophilia TaxID=40324 RepID=UPI000DA77D82|nr:hypothetical protein [Stenotrophomonas maltophilia]PZS98682.1 hypothetical protein A7X66_05475 [Stenotrophomonas maltophilia]
MAGDRHRIPEHKRPKHTGRGKGHSFVQLPHYMIQSPQFYRLGGAALKLLLFLAGQYNGKNNGDLSATESMVRAAGVCAPSKLRGVLNELEDSGFIVKTRHGMKRVCSLYALTWYGIDECEGKCLEIAPGPPRNDWRKTQSLPPSGVVVTPLRGVKAA